MVSATVCDSSLALGTHRSSCLYQAEELVTHLSQSPLSCHLNILAKEKSTGSATRVVSETLFSGFFFCTRSVSCLFVHSHPSQCCKFKPILRWALSADDGVLAVAGAIARCGAQEALACAKGLWGPCRTSCNALTGCPRSRGCPTRDASETPSGRSRVFLLAPGVLEEDMMGQERRGCHSLQMTLYSL